MRFTLMGLVLCGLLATPGFAQNQTLRDSVPSIDVVRNRLHLTPEQEAKLRPMFQQREQQLYETRSKLEAAASSTGKREVLKAAKADARTFNEQVEGVLDSSQKAEWRELRDETRDKVKERYERQQETKP
jgi:periplasmic protein CpxP/Spy